MYKLNQLKTPRERVLELLDQILVGKIDVESISIERFKSEDTGKPFMQVMLELSQGT
jgi:putative methionine-R-sulfoxide reductase with GAF domain